MGLDVFLTYKNRYLNLYIESNLSRRFCNFLCGPDAYSNCEFDQIQKIYAVDLSILRRYPNLEPNIHELEYELYLAEKAKDQSKIKLIQEKIEKTTKDWNDNYDRNFDGWTKIEDLEEVIKNLLERLTKYPTYHKTIKYNFNWGNYFYPKRKQTKENRKFQEEEMKYGYIDNVFSDDLNVVLDWIKTAKENDIEYVGFEYG